MYGWVTASRLDVDLVRLQLLVQDLLRPYHS